MASFNKVILAGNLTRDVELRYTNNNTAVTDVGLAVNDRVKKNGEWVDETTFVEVTMWGRIAEVAAEFLGKGSPVLIEGRLKLETWEDSQSGQKRQKLKVVCERMQMLGTGKGKDGQGGQGGGGNQQSSGGNGGGNNSSGGRNGGGGNNGGNQQAANSNGGGSGGGYGGGSTIDDDDIPF